MTELVNESVNLSYSLVGGKVKLKEPSTGRKDRFTAVAYANYVASLFDVDLLKETKGKSDYTSLLQNRQATTNGSQSGFCKQGSPFAMRGNPFRRR